jgi:predicted aspartyl protease
MLSRVSLLQIFTKLLLGARMVRVKVREVRELPFEEFKSHVCDTIANAETGITRTKIAEHLQLKSRDDPRLVQALNELVRDSRIELHAFRYTFPWEKTKN